MNKPPAPLLFSTRCYNDSFYKGVMLVGEFKGEKVNVAKTKIKEWLIKQKMAVPYSEPEKKVMSRSGNECVAALVDQWYLTYGEDQWRSLVKEHVDNTLETYNPLAKKKFQYIVGWLKEWACSRSFGLGTALPWDEQFVIESLSDSTIYMAYYTIAHYLQSDFNGRTPGSAGIKPEQLTPQVWDCIFLDAPYPNGCGIPKETLQRMNQEFNYWYPMDLRVSGKDLIGNHLTMCLYNHAAIWAGKPEMLPRSFFTNGHLMLNSEKMSKSTGNFMTLKQALQKYGADATRFALADSGDGLDDANFEESVADNIILTLNRLEDYIRKVYGADDSSSEHRKGGKVTFFDRMFLNEMHVCVAEAKQHYQRMQYHEVIVQIRKLLNARDEYREASPDYYHPYLIQWIETILVVLSPICPHFSQAMWQAIGKVYYHKQSRVVYETISNM